MHKQILGCLAGMALLASMSGCSDSSSSSASSVQVNVQVGQRDIQDAYVWAVSVTEGGQLNSDDELRLTRSEYELDDNSEVSPTVATEETHMFMLVPRVADSNLGLEATSRVCQWVAGCEVSDSLVEFGVAYFDTSSFGWRAVAQDLSEDERVRVTPLTHLAAALAYDRQYIESDAGWDSTGYYSAVSVEQSISQVSKLFDIDNIQTTLPIDLSEINQLSSNQATSMDRIRYAALMAAWQYLALIYDGEAETLEDAVAADLVTNNGQLYQKGGDQTLNLETLYQAASDNLSALDVTNSTVEVYVEAVIAELDTAIAAFEADTLTSITPDLLSELFSTDDYDDMLTGLQRTKAFVEVLRSYEDTFFEDGYREDVNAYLDTLKATGDIHEDSFNAVIDAFIDTHELYTTCYLNAACGDVSEYSEWLDQVDSYDAGSAVLTLNNGEITVSQEVADVNATDSDDSPSESHAIDIKIVGTYKMGDLTVVVDHTYENDDEDDGIDSTTGVRVYFTDEVSELVDSAANSIIGYELRLSDFQIYDASNLSTDDELEFDGSFVLFYRGVKDPQDSTSDIRFNIDTLVLDSRISDEVSDDNDDDSEYVNLDVTAVSAYASDYYPDTEFSSFNGFFATNSSSEFEKGAVESALVSYQTGEETIDGDAVQYLDLMVPMGESYRYRLYPTLQREDESDIDGDDDDEELIDVYDYEICELAGNHTDGWSVDGCEPQTRAVGEADFSDFLNALWRSGTLSRIEIPGRGFYFVEWPVALDDDSCLVLDDVSSGTESSMDGTLYLPFVLGLNTVQFTSEIDLDDQPDTLLDINYSAPTSDGYEITAALSHDYSSTSGTTVSIGYGSDVDRIVINYATDADLETSGSFAVYKDGVSLELDDGTSETVDSELELYLNASTGADPMPYEYVINEDGDYERCVLANVAEWEDDFSLDAATLYLNYRDVVYGRVQQENGQWIIRYIDGTWETL